MNGRLISFLFVMLVLASCSDGNDTSSRNDSVKVQYAADTAFIHNILKKAKNGSFANTDSALLYLEKAIIRSENLGYTDGKSEALFLTANILYQQNKYRDALELYNQSLNLAEKQNDVLLKAKCLERMASVNLATGDDHKALKLYYEALPLFKQTKDKEGIAKVYNIIGLYKNAQKKYDTAEIYLNKAILLNKEIGNTTGLIHNKGNLGYVYEKSGQLEKAEAIYLALIDSLKISGDSINLSMMLSNLASLSQKMNNIDAALGYLRQAVGISGKTRDTSMLALLYADIGEIYIENKRIDSAVVFLNKSVLCAKSIGDARTQLSATRLLLRSDTLRNDFREASKRYNSINTLSDTVYARKLRHSLRASELEYESQSKSQLIELQSIDIQNASNQKQLYLVLLLLSSVSVILLGFVIVLGIRNHKRKQELNEENLKIKDLQLQNSINEDEINKMKISKIEEEIRLREREQLTSALALVQKNELLGLIDARISQSTKNVDSINPSELNDILASIRKQLKEDDESNMFNQKFSLLHPDFFENLKQKHPNLSKSELKFCAYLRLNLSGNQIANIMSVTAEAIRKTRYRLRKKLELERHESLEDYISRF
jgi:tetratricopeptide (TPR) repeat protein